MEPLDQRLFSLFTDAVSTALGYVRERRNSNGYIAAHRDWPQLEWQENGTPWLTEALEGPTDYAAALRPPLFPPDDPRKQFRDEPSFVALREYVRAHERISSHLGATYPDMFVTVLHVLLGSMLDRYIHVSGLYNLDDAIWLSVYLPIEKYLLEDTLAVSIVVPILGLRFEVDDVKINDTIGVMKIHDDIHLARTPAWRYHFGFDPRVQCPATHGLALLNYSVANEEQIEMWRIIGRAGAYPLTIINRFFAALRLVTSKPTGYAQLLAISIGWADGYRANLLPLHKTSIRQYPESFSEGYWAAEMPTLTASELTNVVRLFKRIGSITNERLTIALRRLNLNALRPNDEDGLLDAMIGLEALLSDGNQEMTYKIAMRTAALYKLLDSRRSMKVFQELKAIYKLRSKIVHGGQYDLNEMMDRDGQEVRVVDAATEHLRAAARILIERNEYLDVSRIDRDLLVDLPMPHQGGGLATD